MAKAAHVAILGAFLIVSLIGALAEAPALDMADVVVAGASAPR